MHNDGEEEGDGMKNHSQLANYSATIRLSSPMLAYEVKNISNPIIVAVAVLVIDIRVMLILFNAKGKFEKYPGGKVHNKCRTLKAGPYMFYLICNKLL